MHFGHILQPLMVLQKTRHALVKSREKGKYRTDKGQILCSMVRNLYWSDTLGLCRVEKVRLARGGISVCKGMETTVVVVIKLRLSRFTGCYGSTHLTKKKLTIKNAGKDEEQLDLSDIQKEKAETTQTKHLGIMVF